MPTVGFGRISADTTLAQLIEIVGKDKKTLDYILQVLDSKNIRAEGIEAESIKAGAIVTDKLSAGAVTAEKISVENLSAINADLGTIVAGIIYGAYIATANGTYPRIEFSSEDNLLSAFSDANNYVAMLPTYNSAPSFVTYAAAAVVSVLQYSLGTQYFITAPGINYQVSAGGDLELFAGAGKNVKVENWGVVQNVDTSRTLQQELSDLTTAVNNLTAALTGKATSGASTSSVGNHNHGIPDGTVLMVSGGGTVTFSSSGGHSHTQT